MNFYFYEVSALSYFNTNFYIFVDLHFWILVLLVSWAPLIDVDLYKKKYGDKRKKYNSD